MTELAFLANLAEMKANNLPTVKVSEIDHLEAGRYIRGLRTRALMSLRRLSHELGVSAPFLSDLELGRRNWTAERFARAKEAINNYEA